MILEIREKGRVQICQRDSCLNGRWLQGMSELWDCTVFRRYLGSEVCASTFNLLTLIPWRCTILDPRKGRAVAEFLPATKSGLNERATICGQEAIISIAIGL